jgi:hypothetical protein
MITSQKRGRRSYCSSSHRLSETLYFEVVRPTHVSHKEYFYMEIGVFWDVMLCGSFKNRRFGGP